MTSANDVSPISTAIARWNVNIIATANGRPARKSTRTGKKTDARTVVYAPMTRTQSDCTTNGVIPGKKNSGTFKM